MGVGVEEDGASESRSVMGRIGGARTRNITPRASGQTSIWSFVTKASGKQAQEARQMTAATTAGAASHDLVDWHTINWPKAHQNVRRLQARIVKATQVEVVKPRSEKSV